MSPWEIVGLAGLIAGGLVVGVIVLFVFALCRAAAKPTPAVPPAHPRKRVDLNLDDIEWDWKREDAA